MIIVRKSKQDILQLLNDYSKNKLDYLADHIEEIEFELLADALYALSNTFNKEYIPVFILFENHQNQNVSDTAKKCTNRALKKTIVRVSLATVAMRIEKKYRRPNDTRNF